MTASCGVTWFVAAAARPQTNEANAKAASASNVPRSQVLIFISFTSASLRLSAVRFIPYYVGAGEKVASGRRRALGLDKPRRFFYSGA